MTAFGIMLKKTATVESYRPGREGEFARLKNMRERGGTADYLRRLGHDVFAVSAESFDGDSGSFGVGVDLADMHEYGSGSAGHFRLGHGEFTSDVRPNALYQSGRNPQLEAFPALNANNFIATTASQLTTLQRLTELAGEVDIVPWQQISLDEMRNMVAFGADAEELAKYLNSRIRKIAAQAGLEAQKYVLKLSTTSASKGVCAGSIEDISNQMAGKLDELFINPPGKLPSLLLQPYIDSYNPSYDYKFSMVRVFVAGDQPGGIYWRHVPANSKEQITIGDDEQISYVEHEYNEAASAQAVRVMAVLRQTAAVEHAFAAIDFIPTPDGRMVFLEANSDPVRPTRFNKDPRASEIGINLDELTAKQLVGLANQKGGTE